MPLRRNILASPGRTVLLSIFLTICAGTLFLALPIAQQSPVPLLDCFFTATSATCVTGALTVPFESFTLFGKIVILALIQIGGLGLLTLTLFLASLFFNLGLSTQFMIGQVFELDTWRNTKRILFFIIAFTLLCELSAAGAIYHIIKHQFPPGEALFHAFFHSISSFNNAGLTGLSSVGSSMIPYSTNLPMLLITALLIFAGGFGFVAWYELFLYVHSRLFSHKRFHISLTTRIIAIMSGASIIIATLLLIVLEGPSHFSQSPWWTTVSNMLFNAIAYRSTGLTTIDLSTMHLATVFLIIMYSFIGSSPGSTGSGIKITTFTLFLATIRAVIMGRTTVDLKGRRIPQDQIFKAMAVLSLSFCWIIFSTFCLLLIESKGTFIGIFFETVSSFTTLGLATDITPFLSPLGKILIIGNMFIGRVGSLTLLLALKSRQDKVEFQYPEERIMIS
jgi:trk system potassium uptake protein TrkH